MATGLNKDVAAPTVGTRFAVNDTTLCLLANNKYCRKFIPAQSGTLAVHFADDDSDTSVVIAVTAGVEYNMQIKRFLSTGTVTVTHVVAVG